MSYQNLLKILCLVIALSPGCKSTQQEIKADQDLESWDLESSFPVPDPKVLSLPQALKKNLEKKYPGFRIAEKKDYCPNYLKQHLQMAVSGKDEVWAYGLLSQDFNQDKAADYALILEYQGKFILVGALKKSKSPGYDLKTLSPALVAPGERTFKRDIVGNICSGLLVVGPSWPDLDILTPYLAMVNASSAMTFYYQKGQWQETGYEP